MCILTLDRTILKHAMIPAESRKAMKGAAMKDRAKPHRKVNPSDDTSPYAASAPSTAYTTDPVTSKALRTIRTIRADRITSTTASASRLTVKQSERAVPTGPDPLSHNAKGSPIKTSEQKPLRPIAHVGVYTPNKVSYSWSKNHKTTTDRNNMRQRISMLESSSDRHYRKLVSNVFCCLGEILDMKCEISEMELFTQLE